MKFSLFKKKNLKERAEKLFEETVITSKDIVAPPSIELKPNHLKVGERMAKSFFVFSYPRYLGMAWVSPLVNLDIPMDLSFFVHPMATTELLKRLRKRVTELEAEIAEREEKGYVREPALEMAYQDLERLRDRLQSAQERMFKLGVYLTIYADTEKEMREYETTIRQIFEARLIYIKPALYQQKEGFLSCLPYGLDRLLIHTTMNTSPLSSCFPFISFDLSANEGILYGVNLHNNSLVLFDRFTLENANETCFGVAGSGKSYAIKLEILRYLMEGVDVIVVDPENEYQALSDAVGGSFFKISLSSPYRINPLDLPHRLREDEDPGAVLRGNVINLVELMRIMLGGLTPQEDSLLDRALTETYAARDITPDSDPSTWQENIPLLEDLESVLETMEGTENILQRLRKFTKGTFAAFFNQPTNISMDKNLVVFGIRDMEESLRPIAMFLIMRYVWNTVRSELKKRIFVVDEAWWLMQSEDSASFLYGICKRARKYWLGVTTITQDINDFMRSSYGQPIITNAALHLLLKQSPATIDVAKKTFNLTEEEKYLLLQTEVGEGLFFAGRKHVAIKVVASYTEDQIITTAPEEIVKTKKAKQELEQENI